MVKETDNGQTCNHKAKLSKCVIRDRSRAHETSNENTNKGLLLSLYNSVTLLSFLSCDIGSSGIAKKATEQLRQ